MKKLLAYMFLSVLLPFSVLAQSPQVVFTVRSENKGPALSGEQLVDSLGWDYNHPYSISGLSGAYDSVGTLYGDSLLWVTNSCVLSGSRSGYANYYLQGYDKINAYIINDSTAVITMTGTLTADEDTTSGNMDAIRDFRKLTGSPINFSPISATSPSGEEPVSISYFHEGSCGNGSKSFTSIPGETYVGIGLARTGALCTYQSPFNGVSVADGTIAFSVTVGEDSPTISLSGPLVGGSPKTYPNVNDSVTFTNQTYDPDNVQTTPSALLGICSFAWTLEDPDGIEVTGTSSQSSFTATVSKVGEYTLTVLATDNEGQQSVGEVFFTVVP